MNTRTWGKQETYNEFASSTGSNGETPRGWGGGGEQHFNTALRRFKQAQSISQFFESSPFKLQPPASSNPASRICRRSLHSLKERGPRSLIRMALVESQSGITPQTGVFRRSWFSANGSISASPLHTEIGEYITGSVAPYCVIDEVHGRHFSFLTDY